MIIFYDTYIYITRHTHFTIYIYINMFLYPLYFSNGKHITCVYLSIYLSIYLFIYLSLSALSDTLCMPAQSKILSCLCPRNF